jgi:hypothetical protein
MMFHSQCALRFTWASRGESLDLCAQKIDAMLKEFRKIDQRLTGFSVFESGQPKGIKIEPEQTTLALSKKALIFYQSLLSNRSRTETTGELMSDPGSGVRLFNSNSDFQSSISIRCGVTTPQLGNVVTVYIPTTESGLSILTRSQLFETSKTIVRTWNPERGVLIYDSLHSLLSFEQGHVDIGPVNYMLREGYRNPSLPEGCQMTEFEDGYFVYIDLDPFLPHDKSHIKKTKELHWVFNKPRSKLK